MKQRLFNLIKNHSVFDLVSLSAPRAEAAGLRALKLKLADQSKFSLWELRYRQVLKFLPWDACQSQALEPSR